MELSEIMYVKHLPHFLAVPVKCSFKLEADTHSDYERNTPFSPFLLLQEALQQYLIYLAVLTEAVILGRILSRIGERMCPE